MTMTTKPTKEPTTPAQRMRLYRKRRKLALRYIRIPLDGTETDTLIRMRLLKEEQRQDDEALQTAIMTILYRALEDAA
jgi:hypothetical protein